MHLFYSTEFDDGTFILNDQEAYHCIKVLRHRVGDKLYLTDGKGFLAAGIITDIEGYRNVRGRITSIISRGATFSGGVNLYVSILKHPDRFEWLVEKCSELRVCEITPIICERTEKSSVRLDRLMKIATEAMKQSFSAYLTKIRNPLLFRQAIEQSVRSTKTYVATCSYEPRSYFSEIKKEQYAVFIGPEGDFTSDEIAFANEAGCTIITLGTARLRSETAALTVASLFYYHFQTMK